MHVRVVICVVGAVMLLAGTRPAGQASLPPSLETAVSRDLVVPSFTDQELSQLVSVLDTRLSAFSTTRGPDWTEAASPTMTTFARRLQQGVLTAAQEQRMVSHLAAIGKAHPGDAAVAAAQFTVQSLTPGKVAPALTGTDLDAAPIRLADYRGKVVVVAFWGQWCGICRTQYPYERLLLELYGNWPFAIVGVNSDRTRDIAKRAATDNRLTYRSVWDGAPDTSTTSAAGAWRVTGWPTTYVLDGRGVIRFVDLTSEDLLKGVRQLLDEETQRPSPGPK